MNPQIGEFQVSTQSIASDPRMVVGLGIPITIPFIRLQPSSSSSSSSSSSASPDDFLPHRSQTKSANLSFSKPSLIVRTQSNVRIERRKKPEPSCVVCNGSGRVDCQQCNGTGRTNHSDLVMLPKGEWPNWCKTCGGSGLGYCNRCLGTGEYRDIMGFRFMKMETNYSQARIKKKPEHGTPADLFLSQTSPESEIQ